jgi:hypothetical protein
VTVVEPVPTSERSAPDTVNLRAVVPPATSNPSALFVTFRFIELNYSDITDGTCDHEVRVSDVTN